MAFQVNQERLDRKEIKGCQVQVEILDLLERRASREFQEALAPKVIEEMALVSLGLKVIEVALVSQGLQDFQD